MVYKFTISLPDYIYELYIKDYKGNRSELISGLILQGSSVGKLKNTPAQQVIIQKLNEKIKELEKENKKLKFELSKAKKTIINKKKPKITLVE